MFKLDVTSHSSYNIRFPLSNQSSSTILQNDTSWCHISSMKFSMNFTAKFLGGFSVHCLTVSLYSFLCSFTLREPLKLLTQVTNDLHESQLIKQPGSAYYCCLCVLGASQSFLTNTYFMCLLNFLHPLATPLCLLERFHFWWLNIGVPKFILQCRIFQL